MDKSQHNAPVNTLGRIIEKNAARFPARTAVLHEGQEINWADLNARVNRLANAFQALGLQKGDRLAFLLRTTLHWIEVTFAALKMGAVLVPLSYRMAPPELERIIQDCSPSAMVLHHDFLETGRNLSL